jgi:peptide chain release factor 1
MVVIETDDIPAFINEAGGHRIQRVPPTERRGRVHTSTVTVSVLMGAQKTVTATDDSAFEVRFFSGTGSGGQHRNKHQNSVVMTHIPTGLKQTAVGRSKERNLVDAKARLLKMIEQQDDQSFHTTTNIVRAGQIGCGMRGDKKRTYRFQEDQINDHETGKQSSCKKFMRGDIESLWR